MEDLYRQLFNEMPGYITVQDRDCKIIAANRMFRTEFGCGEGDFCFNVIKGRSEKCDVCSVEMTFQDGQCHASEEIVKLKNGKEICVIAYTAPIRDDAGNITAVEVMFTDITKVKRLQQKYRTLFDITPCYITVLNKDFKVSNANRWFEQDFGEGVGLSCYEAYKHRKEPCIDCPVARTFQDGQIHHSEEVVTSREGSQKHVRCYTAPIRDPNGDIVSVMEMSADITDLRQLQSRLTSLGMLVGSISHGIKGLLSGIDGGIYLMETGFQKDKKERVDQGWSMLRRNIERIRSMVMNVLYYAKDRDIFWKSIDVEKIVASVKDILDSRARRHKVELRMKTEPGKFDGDQDAIHSVLINLLENSIDACRVDKSKQSHTVSLSSFFQDEHVVFDIADNGIGMDRETREKAFSLFFSSKGAEGTGLGLFIAHKIIKSHSGTIDIESDPGKGTRFIVKIPRHRQTSDGIHERLDNPLQ
jgi:PAS domain S-box-containing protein